MCALQEVLTLETTQMYLENIMSGIPDKVMAAATSTSASPNELGSIVEGSGLDWCPTCILVTPNNGLCCLILRFC